MIEWKEVAWGRKIRKAACDGQFAFGDLIGVREMNLATVGDARRAKRQFPAMNLCPINRKRKA